MKILVVGMNPSHKPTLGTKKNATFRNLESWMDRLGVKHFSFINTFDTPGQPSMSNVDFDRLKNMSIGYNKVLALGDFASKALDRIDVDHFTLPHPSPLNRKLNDSPWVHCVLSTCKEYLK